MNRTTLLAIGCAAAGVAVMITQIARMTNANARLDSSRQHHRSVMLQADQFHALADQTQTSLYGDPPDADVQASVVRALRSAGLSERNATSIRREADRLAGNDPSHAGIRTREIRAEFAAMSPAELGVFLRIFREHEPAWRISRLTLRKSMLRSSAPDEYDVSMTCSALYIDPRSTP